MSEAKRQGLKLRLHPWALHLSIAVWLGIFLPVLSGFFPFISQISRHVWLQITWWPLSCFLRTKDHNTFVARQNTQKKALKFAKINQFCFALFLNSPGRRCFNLISQRRKFIFRDSTVCSVMKWKNAPLSERNNVSRVVTGEPENLSCNFKHSCVTGKLDGRDQDDRISLWRCRAECFCHHKLGLHTHRSRPISGCFSGRVQAG